MEAFILFFMLLFPPHQRSVSIFRLYKKVFLQVNDIFFKRT